jgi:hypothetical protein
MEGILLGSLSYLGHNYTNKQNNKIKENTLENFYDSNIEQNMNKLEQVQSNRLMKEPEFYKQFDSLKFNTTYEEPSSNIFSDFNNIISDNKNMIHSNMTPFTARRDLYENFTNQSQKYEKLSGNDNLWKNKKEIEPLFEPMRDLTNPFGMPVMTNELQGRYTPSNKNNYGNLPFQTDLKVLPGMDGKESAPYAVTRVNPRNIDDLRSEINKKVSYESKPLETIKKGELRGTDFNISRYKVPSYRENTIDDFVKNAGVTNAVKITGDFAHVDTQRGQDEYLYMGHATDSKQGNFINQEQTYFSDSKKENYLNDFTHSINAVNTRPVFLNTESYTSYENQRLTSTADVRASGINMNSGGSYHIDRKDVANTTLKEQNIHGNTMLGANGGTEAKTYVFSSDAILPMTLRDVHKFDDVLNPAPTQQNIYVNNQDPAKYTIKESTINKPQVANISSLYQSLYSEYCDEAKYTIKESTINKPEVVNINSIQQNVYSSLTDEAKDTNKQTLIEKPYVANINSIQQNVYSGLTDNAKMTIKESTINKPDVANVNSIQQNVYSSLMDEAKDTLKQKLIDKPDVANINSIQQNVYSGLTDNAKMTIKESTINKPDVANVNSIQQNVYSNLNDTAKTTIRQVTGNTNYTGAVGSTVQDTYKTLEDTAKTTVRQITGHTNYTGTAGSTVQDTYKTLQDQAKTTIKQSTIIKPNNTLLNSNVNASYSKTDELARTTIKETVLHEGRGNVGDSNQGHKVQDKDDKARVTIKQTTLITNHVGGAIHDVKKTRSQLAEQNMTIDDKRQITAVFNRAGNAKSDTIRGDINKDTVRLNDKRMVYGYVSAPSKPLDNNVTPLSKTYTDRKTSLNDNNFYRVDPIYIDTLNNNPLVNDIFHQKNIDFSKQN